MRLIFFWYLRRRSFFLCWRVLMTLHLRPPPSSISSTPLSSRSDDDSTSTSTSCFSPTAAAIIWLPVAGSFREVCVLVSLLLLLRLECSSRPVVSFLSGSVGFLLVWFFRLEIVILNLSPHQFNTPILLLTSPYMVLLLLVHLLIWFFDSSYRPLASPYMIFFRHASPYMLL